jgi:hypothetical protein
VNAQSEQTQVDPERETIILRVNDPDRGSVDFCPRLARVGDGTWPPPELIWMGDTPDGRGIVYNSEKAKRAGVTDIRRYRRTSVSQLGPQADDSLLARGAEYEYDPPDVP